MRSVVAVAALALVACGESHREVDFPPHHDSGGTGGSGGGAAVEQPLELPSCTVTSAAPLDCGDEACDGEVGHGLDIVRDLGFDRSGRTYALGLRNVDWAAHVSGELRVSWFDGSRWHLLPMLDDPAFYSISNPLQTVAASGPNDVWLGANGMVAHWDGSAWTSMEVGYGSIGLAVDNSRSVWAASINTLFHFDGESWSSLGWYAGGDDSWGPSSVRLVDNRLEVGGSALSVWDGAAITMQDVHGSHVVAPPFADGWAIADAGIAELRDGEWTLHETEGIGVPGNTYPLWPESLALWQGEVLVTHWDDLLQWLNGSLVEVNAPPLQGDVPPLVFSDGTSLWILDVTAGTAWRLGDECWEASGPTHPRPD